MKEIKRRKQNQENMKLDQTLILNIPKNSKQILHNTKTEIKSKNTQ